VVEVDKKKSLASFFTNLVIIGAVFLVLYALIWSGVINNFYKGLIVLICIYILFLQPA
jgi:fatty acid desaturase